MIKFFTLAAAVSVMPFLSRFSAPELSANKLFKTTAYNFTFKNTLPNPLAPEKKPAVPWSQNWMTTAQENIRKSEYNFKWEDKLNAYCTPNRKNNLRFFYDDKGFSVEPRTTKIPLENYEPTVREEEKKYNYLPGWKVNFNLDKKQVGNGKWQIVNNKAEYLTEKITVQYINNEEGMRQNFIVHAPLSKSDDLKIKLSIKTRLKITTKNNRLQFFHRKTKVLNYQDLKVWDASGKALTASFQKNKTRYFISVDTKGAIYPITIDPISTTPSAIVESNQVNANLGFSVASAGDVNADGYSDVIAGAFNYDNGEIDEGVAFIYHGSATGISNTPAATVESNQVNARLGISVSGAGDVNGDGYADIIAGANLYDNGSTDEGAAYIYHGSSTGINTTAAIIMESNQALAQMGFSVAGAGDVNGDGFSDVIVGAWLFDNPEVNEGVAYVFHGSSTGISGTIATTLEANQSAANYGLSVAGAGDVNGDGYSDVIVGAEDYDNGQTDEGVAFIYLGSAAGINSSAQTFVEGNLTLSQFGFSVASAGDVNGDGYSDVIVGAYLFTNGQANEGCAFIYHGSAAGINSTAVAMVESNQAGAQLGTAVACAGDINGDGYADVICGATLYDNIEINEGAAFVYFGSSAGINIVAEAILESNQANANMGRGLAGAGDVNGDGYSDVIVGVYQYDNGESNEGCAFVYHGSASSVINTPISIIESNQNNAEMGLSATSAGDINGDGYSDIIIGAYKYDNGQADEGAAFVYHGSATGINTTPVAFLESNQGGAFMGYSVASAGDVNSDGYSDVIVGAYQYDNGENNEGEAFIYHGSVTGISTTPARILESNQVGANFGISVAAAGDVNGDGFGDVMVGAWKYTNGQATEGAVFIYHGSTTGISTVAATLLEVNQAGAGFGSAVSSAGDVNGDGFSDIIVGAIAYDNGQTDEGAAFVYKGSLTGINTVPIAFVECNNANAYMGRCVGAAGDINADGYADVIVGAYNYNAVQTAQGAAFVYYGSATGINVTPLVLVDNLANSRMGFFVGTAGDINGDGYSDVLVGAYSFSFVGCAYIYHGAPAGISTVPSTVLASNIPSGLFGSSVASAGDVNGDGYSDVLIGSTALTNGQTAEGGAFIYMGNVAGVSVKRNNLRLYNTDLTTPINSSNFLFSNFGAGLYAKSFLGRAKGKMVWETRLNYNPYSGIPITNSIFFTAQQASFTDMGLTGVELKNVIAKINGGRYTKLRARIKYDPVTAITGQVYSPWRNVSSIIDANHLGVLPIELISFNAAWLQKGKTARLDFKTDKESGICCFDIEKSSDGFNFYKIGTLPAKNISGIQSYSFIDGNATGKKQFYRIKIKGIAGQTDYSNIQQLQNDKATEILVFPNPTTDVLQLQLNKVYGKMNVQIINSAGQTVKQMKVDAANQIISIPVQNLGAGKYWLRLQSGEEKQVLQFVKQ